MLRLQRPDYTDLAVVVGPNLRWVRDDYDDLTRYRPEVLLGYRVLLLTVGDVLAGGLRGTRPSKIVVLVGVERESRWYRAWQEIAALEGTLLSKVECWDVRGAHIERVS